LEWGFSISKIRAHDGTGEISVSRNSGTTPYKITDYKLDPVKPGQLKPEEEVAIEAELAELKISLQKYK